MSKIGGWQGMSLDDIHNKLSELEHKKAEALGWLAGTKGPERVRIKVHLTVLERRIRWYRGRATPLSTPELQGYEERQRRYQQATDALHEVVEAAKPGGEPLGSPVGPEGASVGERAASEGH